MVPSGSPSSLKAFIPSTVPTRVSPSPLQQSPTLFSGPATLSLTNLTVLQCKPLASGSTNTCPAAEEIRPFCRPNRRTDHCSFETSFLRLINSRKLIYNSSPSTVRKAGYWYDLIDDKLGAKLFAEEENIATPSLLYCSSHGTTTGLSQFNAPSSNQGFVIKAVGFHSNKGIFVLPEGFDGPELLSGKNKMTKADVSAALVASNATRVVVEEYIPGETPGTLPDEYKFHMFNGKVGSIIFVSNPGTPCACFAELDGNWNRIDKQGCFQSGNGPVMDGQCVHIDKLRVAPTQMKGLDMCATVPSISSTLLANLTATAQAASTRIGAYMRVDMFVSPNNGGVPVVGEFTAGHTNGLVHCSAPIDQRTGCVDSCYLGKLWKGAGGSSQHGGPPTVLPASLTNFSDSTWESQCETKMATLGQNP